MQAIVEQTAIELRSYQKECIDLVLKAYQEFRKNPCKELRDALLVLPVAAGKTIIFSEIINRMAVLYGLNTLIIAHTDALLDQAAEKYRMIKPDAIIGKVGSGVHEYGGEVTVASVATVSRPEHLKRLRAIGYGLIVTDEAHRSAAASYQVVYDALPDAFHLMVTATPDRLDGKPIIDKSPLYSASIIDMVQQGYLCDMKAIAIRTDVNLDDLHTEMGDYKVSELEDAIDTPARNKRVVDAYKEHANGRRAICFAVTVQHAQNLASAFSLQGIPAAVISGETPIEERNRLYKALRTGEIKVLTNVNVLTEGFDLPLVDCVILARPTQSRVLFIQSMGRGLRLAPGKQNCIILDITDNCFKHRLEPQSLRKVLNVNLKDEETLLETLAREADEKSEREVQVRKLDASRDKDIQLNLLARLDWRELENGNYVLEVGKEKHRIALVPSTSIDGYYSVWAKLAPYYQAQKWAPAMPLDWSQQLAEKRARMLLSDASSVKLIDRTAPWRSQPATETQLEKLAKYQARFHLAYDPATATKGEAADMLDKVFEVFAKWREAKEGKKAVV
jgi:superfamily II DNA or RNA helicase